LAAFLSAGYRRKESAGAELVVVVGGDFTGGGGPRPDLADAAEESAGGENAGQSVTLRYVFAVLWLAVVAGGLYLYFFHRDLIQSELQEAFASSTRIAGILYLLLSAIRPFTLIPSTFLLFAALPFVPAVPLFLLTLVGILLSSSGFYWFSEVLHLDQLFERKHRARLEQLRSLLQRHELPIIIGWSFFLILPTDLLCYVCGTLRIHFGKFLVGVMIGEGTIFALYIFLGDYVIGRLPYGL
jgi:uncharacterized membrane protein YdjX (TVP38/TMEM64 family)